MSRSSFVLLCAVCALALSGRARAQEGPSPQPSPQATPAQPAAPEAQPSPAATPRPAAEDAQPEPAPGDPFATPRSWRGGAPASGPAAGPAALALAVRGTLQVAGRPPAALLEVEGRVLLVHVGDRVPAPVKGRLATLEVTAIDRGRVDVTIDGVALEVR